MVTSLYIHIPFCVSKCRYCSFSSFAGMESLHDRYLLNVEREMESVAATHAGTKPLRTLFFGGGTPTALAAKGLNGLVTLADRLFGLSEDAEVSTEANPGTVDERVLSSLKKGGFNRISIGVQSFSARELSMLGRGHTPEEAKRAFNAARKAGFTNISLDLMYGLPGQTVESWRANLTEALRLGPEHLSLYQLTVEEHTPFADLLARGEIDLPDDDTIVAMDEMNQGSCGSAGFSMYEISNYCRTGFRCRHNVNYWLNNDYFAVGAGAVSYLRGAREKRIGDPEKYCRLLEAGENVIAEHEQLGLEASFRETVVMGLRMTEGVERGRLEARFGLDPGKYYGRTLEKLIRQQLVELTATHLRVTPAGRIYSNIILSELV